MNKKWILLATIFFLVIVSTLPTPTYADDVCKVTKENPTTDGKIISYKECYDGKCNYIIKDGKVVSDSVFLPEDYTTTSEIIAEHYINKSITMYFDVWRDVDNDGGYEHQICGAYDTGKTSIPPNQPTNLYYSGKTGDAGRMRYHIDLGQDKGFFSYACLADVKVDNVYVVHTTIPTMSISSLPDKSVPLDESTKIDVLVKNTMPDKDPDPEYPALNVKVTITVAGQSFSSSEEAAYILEGKEKVFSVPITVSSAGVHTASVSLTGNSIIGHVNSSTQTFTLTALCGNGIVDPDETCQNCPQDFNCEGKGLHCSPDTGKCEECIKTEDCAGKENWLGVYVCAGDQKTLLEKGVRTAFKCENYKCTGSEDITRTSQDCGDRFCQDGHCGCSEGCGACAVLKGCVKKKVVKLNQPCGCDFQCEEGFCDGETKQCVKGLNIQVSSEKTTLSVGEETTVCLSVTNPLNRDVKADILLSLGDGIKMTEVLSGVECVGNQCKLDQTPIPAGSKKDVTIKIMAMSGINTQVSADVSYNIGEKRIEFKDKTTLKISECGNGKVENGETNKNCCLDVPCEPATQFYSYTCNKKTKSCEAHIQSIIILGVEVGLAVILIIVSSIVYVDKYRPKRVKKPVEEKVERPISSIAEEIEKLADLKEKGILTKKEFEQKKKQLLEKK